MSENLLSLIVLISPAIFVAVAVISWFQPGLRPKLVSKMSAVATAVGIAVAAFSAVLVSKYELLESALLGTKGFGLSIRLDSVSVLMLCLIALLSFIIIKFTRNYLDGDQKQGTFLGRMAATIASVQLLVLAGNLGLLFFAWILTSLSLHRLLVFYRSRSGALIAAKKKFILARLGDVCILFAIILLYSQYNTGNLEVIFSSLKNGRIAGNNFMSIEAPALFLALAALLKSAQFPTHGWLIEVMETPTPVSALLHAGLLNAGPFLIIRMAYVMDGSSIAPVLLVLIGGFTAFFGSVVYLTQTSVKTALGYSSIAHMGFSLMVCGLGVYPAAMLHLVAHSFYKAHAFLSSGSVIDSLRSSRIRTSLKKSSFFKTILGVVISLAVYAAFLSVWNIDWDRDISLLFIGAVIVMGLSRIFSAALEAKTNSKLLTYAVFMGLVVTAAFFILESGTARILSEQLPELTNPGFGKLAAITVIMISFAIVVSIQMFSGQIKNGYNGMAIHFRNGFYANAIFDRLIGSLEFGKKQLTELQPNRNSEVLKLKYLKKKEDRESLKKYKEVIQLHAEKISQR